MATPPFYNRLAIQLAIQIAISYQQGATEDNVSRYFAAILAHYFPLAQDWLVTPDLRTPTKKKPDLTVERMENNTIQPRIYVELKSMSFTGSFNTVIEQLRDATLGCFDGVRNAGFLIVVKGREIAFLECHRYLDPGSPGRPTRCPPIIPFNRLFPDIPTEAGRPSYQGCDSIKFPGTDDGYVLDILQDQQKVHEVLVWMQTNETRCLLPLADSD